MEANSNLAKFVLLRSNNKMTRGIIYLYSYGEELLLHTTYYSVKNRKEVLEGWRHIYGKLFNECYYHIRPDTGTEMIKQDGNNKMRGRPELEKLEPTDQWWKRSGRYPGSPLVINGNQEEGFSKIKFRLNNKNKYASHPQS